MSYQPPGSTPHPPPGDEHTQPVPQQHPQGEATAAPHAAPHDGPTPPYQPAATSTAAPPQRSGRGRIAVLLAAVLVAALIGGVAGAAGWAAIDEDDDGGSTTDPGISTAENLEDRNADVASAGTEGVEQVAASVLPSVVKIDVQTAEGAGSGSGVILSSDGQILTNNHVVEAAVGPLTVSFDDGTTAEAEVVGTDPLIDVAVIQVDGVEGLVPAALGSSTDISVGEEVVAVGSPFGLESTVTSGIVSAVDRPIDAGSSTDSEGAVFPAIQTDAAINPGNSGGALVDLSGNVIGINTAIRTSGASTGGSIGLGFAVPVDVARPIVDEIAAGDEPTHARIGVQVQDAVSEAGTVIGAEVAEIEDGSAAAEAGLEQGDVITTVDGLPVLGSNALVATIRKYRPGDDVELRYLRDGEPEETTATLASDEGDPAS